MSDHALSHVCVNCSGTLAPGRYHRSRTGAHRCGPCHREYLQLKAEHRRQRLRETWFSTALQLLLLALVLAPTVYFTLEFTSGAWTRRNAFAPLTSPKTETAAATLQDSDMLMAGQTLIGQASVR